MRVVVLIAVIATLAHVAPNTSSGCGFQDAWTSCEVSNSGSSVDVTAGTITTPDDNPDTTTTDGSPTIDSPDTPLSPSTSTTAPDDPCHELHRCDMTFTVGTPTTLADLPPITLADLASFTPTPPTLTTEPTDLALTNTPTNLLTTAPTETIPGHLLDHPVTVRFTPTTYHYDHGDGTTLTTHTPSTTWTTLGQPPYTPTPTSHTYTHPGTYTPTATITYTADINFGTGWHPIPGTLHTTTDTHTIRILQPHTALVHNTCTETPTAPGC